MRKRELKRFACLISAFGLAHLSVMAQPAGAPVLIPSFLKFEAYNNITGTPIQGLLDGAKYPNSPDTVLYMSSFDTRTVYPDDSHENYGARISGFVTPAESGNYEFFLRSDDASQLFISKDENPANLDPTPIAEETGCCNAFQETGAAQTSPPIALVAGKRYAIQVLYKEGGGGDYAQVAWRKAGDITPSSRLTPIPGAFLSAMIPANGTITVSKQPANITAAQNDFVTLSLDATSTQGPLVIQWQKNGASIPGLTGRSVIVGPLGPSDNAAKFRALLSIPGATATSGEATLTLTPDVTPPKVLSVTGSDTFDTVTVNFSEAVTPASAGAAANYSLDGGLTVSTATVLSPTRVKIATSKQTIGASYTLTIKNIVDTAGVSSAPDTKQSFPAFVVVPGGLKFEAFLNIDGTPVQNLLDDPKFQANNPDVTAYVTQFTSRLVFPTGPQDNYGGRMSGWIVPTETAQYEFFIRSDDTSQLFLSPDDKPQNAVMIAEATTTNDPFQEPGVNGATSTPQSLTAGKRYSIYALWKEGTGDDYCDVAWRKVGDSTAAKGLPFIPGTVLETYGAPGTFTPPTVAITSPAAGDSLDPGAPVTLTASASGIGGKTIAKVEFFELGKKAGEATSSPFSITVTGLTEDAHVFTARATDSAGLFADSAPLSFSVGGLKEKVTLLAIDDKTTWRYDRSGQDLGTAWREKNYDDSKWPEGKTLIADETTTTVEPIRTPISRFNDNNEYVITFYFRTHFNFDRDVTPAVKLQLRHAVDDGAVFYLNGVEIHRFGLDPAAALDSTTLFGGHENAYEGPFDVPTTSLVKGDNVLTAEVHQSSTSSSDMVFGAELIATVPVVPVVKTLLAIDETTTWRYDRSGQDLGTAWREKSYDDSKWPVGKTLIADETTTTVEPIRTPVSRFNDNNEYVITFYFRTHFGFPGTTIAGAKLKLRHAVDDGAIFYLNGVEIHRFGFDPAAVVDATTLAAGHENAYEGPFDIPVDHLVPGDNVLAAEVHQSSTSSSDMVFGAELIATYFSSTPLPPDIPNPRMAITHSAANVQITWTEGGTLQSADAVTGSWTDVTSATSPYTIAASNGVKFFRVRK